MALPTKLGFRQILSLVGIASLGVGIVVTGLVVMNSVIQSSDNQGQDDSVSFNVEPPPPDPPPDQPEPQQQPQRQRNRPSLAPPPDLGSNLSGIQVALPEFQAQGVESVSESLLGELEDVALTEETVDEPPVKRNAPTPPYPERAKQREIQGEVRVSLLVGANGNVQRLKILEANPPGVFDEAVQETVGKWTFRPARYNGEPVETWVTIRIPFQLN